MKKKLFLLPFLFLQGCNAVFVWTVKDVVGIAVLIVCILAFIVFYVEAWIQEWRNKRKKRLNKNA